MNQLTHNFVTGFVNTNQEFPLEQKPCLLLVTYADDSHRYHIGYMEKVKSTGEQRFFVQKEGEPSDDDFELTHPGHRITDVKWIYLATFR